MKKKRKQSPNTKRAFKRNSYYGSLIMARNRLRIMVKDKALMKNSELYPLAAALQYIEVALSDWDKHYIKKRYSGHDPANSTKPTGT